MFKSLNLKSKQISHPFRPQSEETALTQEGIMLSAQASLAEFVDQIAEQPYDDIIILTDREATAAQRQCCKHGSNGNRNGDMETYALLLKDLLVYMRHGVATRALRGANCEKLSTLPRS
jgi:hypothetical protein